MDYNVYLDHLVVCYIMGTLMYCMLEEKQLKFAHIADTHIKNLKYHYEYRIIFEQLYEKHCEKQNVDYIIHCGDIAHTKDANIPRICRDVFAIL